MASFHVFRPSACLILFIAYLFYPALPASAQHFTNCLSRSSNATILVPGDVTAELGNNGLAPGDEIALFTADSTCAGVGVWDGTNLAVSAAGSNSQETGGYEDGEPLSFRVWDASDSLTYNAAVDYAPCDSDDPLCRDDGHYQTDAFYMLANLTAEGTVETADLRLEATTDSVHAGLGEAVTIAFILSNDGPEDARDLAVTTLLSSALTVTSATPSRGDYDIATSTWMLDDLAAHETDTLTVTAAADRAGTFAFTAEVSANALSDPDSTPDNDAEEEDDRDRVSFVVNESTAACAPSTLDHEKIDRSPDRPGALTVIITNPEGVIGVRFVDADGRPALNNLTAATARPDFTTLDGVRWRHEGAEAPTSVAFTLTQADRRAPEAQYEAEALSVCADPNPRVTHFDPSPVFAFDGGPVEVMLEGNAPNPFRQLTAIHFTLSTPAMVRLAVYDMLGRKVTTLVDDVLPGGPHAIRWNGRSNAGRAVASGVYLYRLQIEGTTQTGRMNVVR